MQRGSAQKRAIISIYLLRLLASIYVKFIFPVKHFRLLILVLTIFLFASCHGTWTDETKRGFYVGCTTEALKWAGTPDKAQEYCDCVFAKMITKYPIEKYALDHMDSVLNDPDIRACKEEMIRGLVKEQLLK